ncbi:MAG: hypothetical protein AAGA48_03030 [Myxococcota bacterium]
MMTSWIAVLGLGCTEPAPDLGPTTLADPTVPQPTEPPAPTDPQDPTEPGDPFTPGTGADCEGEETYPLGAVDPMAIGQVLSPYAWPNAIHNGTGTAVGLDLALTPCNLDPNIDWSAADVLLFMSIPFW